MFRSNVPPGDLPDGWCSRQLRDVAAVHGGGRLGLTKADYVQQGVKAYSAAGSDGYVTQQEGVEPSIILSSIGARCGKSFLTDGPWATLANTQVITPDRSVAEASYLIALLDNESYWNRSGSAQPFIKPSDVKGAWVPLPPLDEQQGIAELLRSVDDAIALERQCRDQAKTVRTSLLQEHFHMGDWADGLPLPDSWQLPLLDSVAVRGSGHTPNKKMPEYWDGEIRWVSLQDTKRLDQVYIADTSQRISPLGIDKSSAVLHPDGVVVISRDATVGRSAITVGPMAVSQHFIAYHCGPKLDNHYLYYWLQHMKPVFERIGAGSTIKTIGLPFFKGLRIALPPIELQKHVASVMLDVDLGIMACEKATAALSGMKANLMSDLLSGRVRVPA